MAHFDSEIVAKIGSMALIRKEDNDINYNIFSRLCGELRPGIILISSGATEIGRVDYFKRNGRELLGDLEDVKADYASQGQSILMENYRRFISQQYSVRQLLVEHQHFNDSEKREHVRSFLLRCAIQGAVPIINYNDPVSFEENRHTELVGLKGAAGRRVVECIDNDETASVIATLVRAKYLVIFTSVDGIYRDVDDPATLVEEISGATTEEVIENIGRMREGCVGASRPGAGGARAKLEFIVEPLRQGTTVIITHAANKLSDAIKGDCKRTWIGKR